LCAHPRAGIRAALRLRAPPAARAAPSGAGRARPFPARAPPRARGPGRVPDGRLRALPGAPAPGGLGASVAERPGHGSHAGSVRSRRISISRQLGAIYLLIVVLLGAVCLVVLAHLDGMRTDSRRLFEETTEHAVTS